MADSSHPDSLDDGLRQVDLPAGMVERLKSIAREGSPQQAAHERTACDLSRGLESPTGQPLLERLARLAARSDAELDDVLCDVPIPESLLADLRGIPADEQVERQLRDVPLPPQQVESLCELPRHVDLDGDLRDVVVPGWLTARLKRIPTDERIDAAIREVPCPPHFAARLSASILRSTDPPIPPPVVRPRPRPIAAPSNWQPWVTAAAIWVVAWLGSFGAVAGILARHYPRPHDAPLSLKDSTHRDNESEFSWAATRLVAPAVEITSEPELLADLRGRSLLTPVESGVGTPRQMAAVSAPPTPTDPQFGSQSLAMPLRPTRATQIKLVRSPRVTGLSPPRGGGYDLLALLRDNAHPFIDPLYQRGGFAVPISPHTEGFWSVRSLLEHEQSLDPLRVRVEDFVAAMPFDYPQPPPGAVEVAAFAGPSPWRNDHVMLQVGMQASGPRIDDQRPGSLLFVVDRSAFAVAQVEVSRVLAEAVATLNHLRGPHRIAVIAAGRTSMTMLPWQDSTAQLESDLDRLPISSDSLVDWNLAAEHVRLALAGAGRAREGEARHVVLLTAADRISTRAAQQIQTAIGGQARLQVVDLGSSSPPDAKLQRLAETSLGKLHRYLDLRAWRTAILEMLVDASPRVAENVRSQIEFNPRSVMRFRLLGNEATSRGGLQGAERAGELYLGESATSLYEVQLRPDGEPLVATISTRWLDPVDGAVFETEHRVWRAEIAATFAAAEPALQLGMVAAAAAEWWRESPRVPPGATLRDVLRWADQVHPEVHDQWRFRLLVDMLESCLKTHRSDH